MISFDDYDLIQDEIYRYSGMILRFNVRLFNYNLQQQKRECFYTEFRRSSSRNLDTSGPSTMMRRKMDYFLSIAVNFTGVSAYAVILPKHMISLNIIIQNLISFLISNTNWIEKDDRLSLKGKVRPQIIPLTDTGLQWISFEPIVHINQNNQYARGVRMTINHSDTFIDCDINGFMGFAYTCNNLNMYLAAQNILMYYGRPDPGTNRVDFNEDSAPAEYDREVVEKPKRVLKKFSDQFNTNKKNDLSDL